MKRIVLFLATSLAVLLVLSVVAHLLGLDVWLAERGGSLSGLLVWAALFGFGGAFISLAMSKMQAKMFMGVQVIGPSADPTEQWLLSVVENHARKEGDGRRWVGMFAFPEPNAYENGSTRNCARAEVTEEHCR